MPPAASSRSWRARSRCACDTTPSRSADIVPDRLRLMGGEAVDPQVQAILNANLPLPVEPMQPLRNVDSSTMKPNDRRGDMSEWTVALGLALKTTREHFANRDGKKRDPNAPLEVVRRRRLRRRK